MIVKITLPLSERSSAEISSNSRLTDLDHVAEVVTLSEDHNELGTSSDRLDESERLFGTGFAN